LFGRHTHERHAGALQPPDELARERRDQEPLAVQQYIDRSTVIDGSHEGAHALDEELAMGIAIAPIALQLRGVGYGRRNRKWGCWPGSCSSAMLLRVRRMAREMGEH